MKKIVLVLSIISFFGFTPPKRQYITRNGNISFFSYAAAENIKATNMQALSILDLSTKKIAVSMLMRAFTFEKALMQEHFNDSYIESDLYPRATFEGTILNFQPGVSGSQTRIIKGDFTLHGVTQPIKIKVDITNDNGSYIINGTTDLIVKDYKIKIPRILSSKIAETVKVTFYFKYNTYEK